MDDIIKNIDWKLLSQQKNTLFNLQDSNKDNKVICNNISGLINLIDNIQDYAVDNIGIKESDVFIKNSLK